MNNNSKNSSKNSSNNLDNNLEPMVVDTMYDSNTKKHNETHNNPVFNTSNNVIYTKTYKPNTHSNTHSNTQHYSQYNNDMNNVPFCSNCGKHGHIFRKCDEPIYSYGLICFYKKKMRVKDNTKGVTGCKKTRKQNDMNSDMAQTAILSINKKLNTNTNKIKILKRCGIESDNLQISHDTKLKQTTSTTLKNNPINTDIPDIQPDIDESVDGIIDIDNNNSTNTRYNMDNLPANSEINEYINDDVSTDVNASTDVTESNMKDVYMEKVLLVQRKNTIGFIEFLRGKYEPNSPEYIIKLFNMMTYDEKKMLSDNNNFDTVRNLIGLKRESNYRTEYDDAKRKFTIVRDTKYNDITGNGLQQLISKSYTRWTTPEWGLPKGRRSNKEFDLECAIREFVEETGIKNKNICVYKNVKPLEEIYKGINGIVYKHIYYLASIKECAESDENIEQIENGSYASNEIGDIKLFNLSECHKIIRPYYVSKLNVIKKGFQLINSLNYFFE